MSEDSLRDEYVLCAPDLPIFTHVSQRRPGDSLGAQEISSFSHQVFQIPLCSTTSLESSHPIVGDYSNVHKFYITPIRPCTTVRGILKSFVAIKILFVTKIFSFVISYQLVKEIFGFLSLF